MHSSLISSYKDFQVDFEALWQKKELDRPHHFYLEDQQPTSLWRRLQNFFLNSNEQPSHLCLFSSSLLWLPASRHSNVSTPPNWLIDIVAFHGISLISAPGSLTISQSVPSARLMPLTTTVSDALWQGCFKQPVLACFW